MNCNWKTMIKIAVAMGVALTVAYFAFPAAQAFVLASAPILLALVCPVAMVAMFFTMKGNKTGQSAKPDEDKAGSALGAADIGASWPGGFYCPCHGSKFDLAGRVFKNVPAPSNLEVPPHHYPASWTLLIGVDPTPDRQGRRSG